MSGLKTIQFTEQRRSRFGTTRFEVLQKQNTEYLDLVSSLNSALSKTNARDSGYADLFRILYEHATKLIPFQAGAFLLTESGEELPPLAFCEPSDDREWMHETATTLVQTGTFAWALQQDQAVVLYGATAEQVIVLHTLATRSRCVAMFMGLLQGKRGLSDESALRTLSVFMVQGAYTVENAELNRQIMEHAESLEGTIQERTGELTRALQIAEESNRAKSHFLANMSHEIRTPMNGIIGTAELLQQSGLNAHQQELVSTLIECGDSLLRIISDILDFSRIESGKLAIQLAPFNLRTCASDSIRALQAVAERRGLSLSLNTHPDLPQAVLGDGLRVRQILTNLLGNAIKFTQQGSVRVEIEPIDLHPQGDGSEVATIEFRVIDTGVGIPSDKIGTLFRPFSQVDTTSTRIYGGTGLGLAICRSLCDLMGGIIWVESDEGRGSTFSFRLPFSVVRLEQRASRKRSGAIEAPMAHSHPLRVLVAFQLEVQQAVITRMLLQLGYEADTSGSLKDAAAAVATRGYDVVLLDAALDLASAKHSLRTNPSGRTRPQLIALSKTTSEEEQARCLGIGMDAWLGMPLRFADLRDVLSRCPNVCRRPPTTVAPRG